MILNNTTKNINWNKSNQSYLNNQMTTQKKIQRPSENPVIAIRALRLRSSLSQINQYYEKNIPDVEAWFKEADTAIHNMNKIFTDCKTQCVYGTNDPLNEDDRKSILESLTALKKQLYSEGNADNAGRTLFTGFRTNSKLTFMKDDPVESYDITQTLDYSDISEFKYYDGSVKVPQTTQEMLDGVNNKTISDTKETVYDRIRLAYDDITDLQSVNYTINGTTTALYPSAGGTFLVYDSEEDWAAAKGGKVLGDEEVAFIKNSGDLILSSKISNTLKDGRASIQVDYEKTGFKEGELRPEYYYNCTCKTDPDNLVEHKKYDAEGNKIYEDINFNVAINQSITVNMQADELFDMNVYQDVVELTNAVEKAIAAHDKVKELESMKNEAKYSNYQDEIQKWIDAAEKEADYADKNMHDLYSAGIGKFDRYLEKLNVAYAEVGARGQQLTMTKNRLENQQLTVEELKSTNENRDLSDIIIDYTAAYNAYQASLMAASKIEKETLLNYI